MTKSNIHIYIIWLSAFLMAACTDTVLDDEGQDLVPMTIEAMPEATRTSLEGTSVLWSEGDEVAVYDFKAPKHRFTSQTTDGRTKFVGKVTAKSEPFAAIYPFDLAGETGTSTALLAATLPSEQYAVADGFPVGMNISVAKGARNIDGSPSSVTFRNVCQLLRFSVPAYVADKVTSIVFTAQTAVAGKLGIDYSGATPIVGIASTESKTITVLPPRRTSTFAAGTYYILTAPVRLNGFTMTMQTVEGKTYSLASTTQFGGDAGRIYSLGNIDLVNTPTVTDCHHIYSTDNMLQGTTLTVSGAPIEGKPWTVNIKNSAGTVVRTLSITGDSQTSDETDAAWPYIPAGSYTVECKYTTSNNREITKTLPALVVPTPTITLTANCYTAHTKYEQGEVVAANQCERLTVYSPSAKLSVAPALMQNANYTRTFKRTLNYNNQSSTTTEATNSPSWSNYTGVAVSGSLYTFSVTANFAGTQVTASKQVRITGLPANFQPPTQSTGWSNDEGTTNFNSDHVRLGNYSLSQPHRIKNTSWFNIPKSTRVALDYDIVLHRAAVNTTANVKMGDQLIVECTDSKYNNDVHNTGIKQFTLSNNGTSVTCEGTYGSGATCTKVYKLNFSYGTN